MPASVKYRKVFLLLLSALPLVMTAQEPKLIQGPRINSIPIRNFYASGNNYFCNATLMSGYSAPFYSSDAGNTWQDIKKNIGGNGAVYVYNGNADTTFIFTGDTCYYTTNYQQYKIHATKTGNVSNIQGSKAIFSSLNPTISAPINNNTSVICWRISYNNGRNWKLLYKGLSSTYVTVPVGHNTYQTTHFFAAPVAFADANGTYVALYETGGPGQPLSLIRFNNILDKWETISSNFASIYQQKHNYTLHYYNKGACLLLTDLVNGTVYRSTDLGANWNVCGNGLPSDTASFAGNYFEHQDTLFALTMFTNFSLNGTYPYKTDLFRLYYSIDNAASFSPLPLEYPKGVTLSGSFVDSNRRIFLYGESIYKQSPGGNPFISCTRLTVNPCYLQSIYPGNGKIIAGTYYDLYKSEDNGNTWKQITAAIRHDNITSVLRKNDTIVIACPEPYVSFDAGDTWIRILPAVSNGKYIGYFWNRFYLFQGNGNNKGELYYSNDLLNWTKQNNYQLPGFATEIKSVVVKGKNMTFLDNSFYLSADSGKTWSMQNAPLYGTPNDAYIADAGKYLIATKNNTSTTETMMLSADDGVTWANTKAVGPAECYSIIAPSPDTAYLHSKRRLRKVGTNNFGGVDLYRNFNVKFADAIAYADNKIFITAVDTGGIYEFDLNLFTGLPDAPTGIDNKLEGKPMLFVYPNPASNRIEISSNSDDEWNYTLQNVCGKAIVTGHMNHTTTLDMNGIDPGIYFITLVSKTQTLTQRLVVAR